MKPSNRRWLPVWICALLTSITLTAFWPVLNNDFIKLDDHQYLLQNPNVQHGLTWESVKWAFQAGYASNWHPLTWLSHLLDVEMFGFNPCGHHAVNLLLHVANTVLLFLILRRMTGALWRSAFVAALFAVHPLHVESVAWAAERKDVLSGFFFMLTLGAYLRYVEAMSAKWRWYSLTLMLFALGLMSKPMLVTVPCLLLLLDVWPLKRLDLTNKKSCLTSSPPLLVEKIPFLILCAASSYVTFVAQDKGHSVSALATLPLDYRLANAVASYCKYLGKTIWPTNLAIFYPYPTGHDGLPGQWQDWQIPLATLLLAAGCLFVCARIKATPWLAIGWFWYLGMLVPVIGIVQVGAQSMADRYTYLPLIGLFIGFSWTMVELLGSHRAGKLTLIYAGAAVIAICILATRRQTQLWRNSFTLFSHALEVDANNAVAHDILGQELWKQGQHKAAKEHFLAAIRSDPHYEDAPHDFAVSATQLGATLAMQGKLAEAVEEFQSALQVKPTPQTYNALGMALWQLGRHAEALEQYAQALRLQPEDAAAHEHLGMLYLGEGQLNDAAKQFEETWRLRPDAQSRHDLGMARAMQGRVEEAISQLKEALQLEPDSVATLNDLAWILATTSNPQLRDGARAVDLAKRACQLTEFKQTMVLGTLAAAYAEAGRFEEAAETAEKTVTLALAENNQALADKNRQLLELYHARKPYREPAVNLPAE